MTAPSPQPFRLDDRVALVTGASRGIGAATARTLAEAGAVVVLVARDRVRLDALAGDVDAAGGQALVFDADLTGSGAAADVVARTIAQVGRLDVLCAFAGGSTGAPAPLDRVEDDAWSRALDNNLTTTFHTLRAVVPPMVEQAAGSLITMASTAARGPVSAPVEYAAAKAGIAALTRQVALEVGPHGVRANCLAPSTIRTERLDRVPSERLDAMAERHPLRRLGTPEDVAHAALFLASDASGWITGTTLDVAGGLVM